jgi:hypothetical protein
LALPAGALRFGRAAACAAANGAMGGLPPAFGMPMDDAEKKGASRRYIVSAVEASLRRQAAGFGPKADSLNRRRSACQHRWR